MLSEMYPDLRVLAHRAPKQLVELPSSTALIFTLVSPIIASIAVRTVE